MIAALLVLAWIGAIAWPALLVISMLLSRRLRASRIARTLSAAGSLAWAGCVWAFLIEPSTLQVKTIEVESPTWRGAPTTIGLIADVHVGPHMSPARVRRIVARMNAAEPDMVILLGDYVSGHIPRDLRGPRENAVIDEGIAALGGLRARLGVTAVLGNHDWWYDGDAVEATLASAGVPVLENAAADLGEGVWLAGLADDASLVENPDWGAALSSVPSEANVIATGHRPDIFEDAPARAAITLAGHSHCGQIFIPGLGRPAVSRGAARWPCGLYEADGRLLYVTGGVGVSMVPARFRAPPEIVLLTLAPPGLEPGGRGR